MSKRLARMLAVSILAVFLFNSMGSACTTILVGKKASVDGSVMVTHTCDGWYDNRVRVIPGGNHPEGEMVPVYKEICHGTRPDLPLVKVGEIPQVKETYTYFHVAYPFMNEHQVIMGEATWTGRDENYCPNGWMMIEQLQVFGLQRAKTAREAIKVMTGLAEKYGYGDGGETLLVIDKNEGWIFDICGPGPLWTPESRKPGAIWVAQRVPDDCITVVANRTRIGTIDWDDKENFVYSSNIKSFAQEMGWWKPGEPFVFHKIYNPEPYGTPYYQQRREWRVLSLLAPSLKLKENAAEMYPLMVKPDKKVSVKDLIKINRDYHEGTRFDLTKGLAAGPFGTPNRYSTPAEVRPEGRKHVDWTRAISMFRCSYSFVAQARSWLPDPLGGVLWFGEDAPHSTVYMPIYAGVTSLPKSITECTRAEFDRDSAYWAFNFVSNWADLKFNYMIQDIKAAQKAFEDEFFMYQPVIEEEAFALYRENPAKAKSYLTEYVNKNINKVVNRWWTLARELVGKYCDGFITYPDGKQESVGYPTWWLETVEFGKEELEPKE
ncbi:MAG: C69 family dipeptidase [Acetomicrobium sp.]|jgi:dipeptidase